LYVTNIFADVEPPVVKDTPLTVVVAPNTPVLRFPVEVDVRTPASGEGGQEKLAEPLATVALAQATPGTPPERLSVSANTGANVDEMRMSNSVDKTKITA
jgi:hypothetical protein